MAACGEAVLFDDFWGALNDNIIDFLSTPDAVEELGYEKCISMIHAYEAAHTSNGFFADLLNFLETFGSIGSELRAGDRYEQLKASVEKFFINEYGYTKGEALAKKEFDSKTNGSAPAAGK